MTFDHTQSFIWWSNGCRRAGIKLESEIEAMKGIDFERFMKLWARKTRVFEFSCRSYLRWNQIEREIWESRDK